MAQRNKRAELGLGLAIAFTLLTVAPAVAATTGTSPAPLTGAVAISASGDVGKCHGNIDNAAALNRPCVSIIEFDLTRDTTGQVVHHAIFIHCDAPTPFTFGVVDVQRLVVFPDTVSFTAVGKILDPGLPLFATADIEMSAHPPTFTMTMRAGIFPLTDVLCTADGPVHNGDVTITTT